MELKKKYLKQAEKYQFVKQVVLNATEIRDGVMYVDYIRKESTYDMLLLINYYGMELDDIDMDELYESDKMSILKKKVPRAELKVLDEFIALELKQETDLYNALVPSLGRLLERLSDKLPDANEMNGIIEKGMDVVEKLPGILNKISPQNLKLIQEAFTKK